MSRIVVTEFISVDGVIEDPGGEGTERGGWAFAHERGEAGDQFKAQETMEADALLLGRVTYEGFAKAWPERTGDPFSDKFNAMPKYVVSSTLTDPAWNNTRVLGGDLDAALATLREEVQGDAIVHGSAALVQSLLERDAVDELRLMTYPVVLGAGKRLFAGTPATLGFTLRQAEPVGDDGISVAVYERAR